MRRRSAPEVTRRRRRCTHYWLIETPHGITSKGHCRRCGMNRRFRNRTPDKRTGFYVSRAKSR